jgi:hypothetical protein
MLKLPGSGFKRSVNHHNVKLDICCDWLEASALFHAGELSGAEVVDVLREQEIYASQDFAWDLVTDAFLTIGERNRVLGEGYPFEVVGANRLRRRAKWEEFPAYSFCLVLSLPQSYPEWARKFGADFTEQGSLFEQLTGEAVTNSLAGWSVHSTGWAPSAPSQLSKIVAQVSAMLGEATGDIKKWTKDMAKEAGLDLLCYLPFPDNRVGVPTYLFQCASGGDWKDKQKTPDLELWTKAITFAVRPKKALAIPFALSESDYTYHCNIVAGLFLDRHRLLAPGREHKDWISPKLAKKMTKWTRSRIKTLPSIDVL